MTTDQKAEGSNPSECAIFWFIMLDQARFNGISSLYSPHRLNALKNSHVLIIGLGGVGSWAVEALGRSGVGELTLVDLDDICVTNTNRQIHAHEGNYGRLKVDALTNRLKSINPDIKVNSIQSYYSKKNSSEILEAVKYDFVIDAIDSVNEKCELINACYKLKLPLVICGGAGGKSDPTKIKIADLSKTKNDLLLRHVRKKLKREYKFPLGWTRAKVKAIYSEELAIANTVCSTETSVKLDCEGSLGSITHMTGTYGFYAAYVAITDILARVK